MSQVADSSARTRVTAVVVAHDGQRWLPQLISGLEASTTFPDRLVAVDTGSTDESRSLLTAALGEAAVVDAPADFGFGAAVKLALSTLPVEGSDPIDEWIWLLHDDCTPAPEALQELLAMAQTDPAIAAVGCRVRAWPRARRLLEVGVSITGTGRRETGLEPGEHDQGQYDDVRDVLAVSTAGCLIRRRVWDELGGLDPELPLFRDDVDFGWRAAKAGHRVVVAPQAVLFHAEAATRGVRPIANTARRPHRADRRAALFTLLANCSALGLPFQYLRVIAGSLLRMLGYLLGKLPQAAADELAALASVLLRPQRVVAARSRRRRTASAARSAARELLPHWWVPYAHGLDSVVTRVAEGVRESATTMSTSARRLRAGRTADESLESGPVADEAVNLPSGAGPAAWARAHPLVTLSAMLTVCALVAGRGLWGAGFLQGGGLLPAPGDAGDWWRLYTERWHSVGLGSEVDAAPYVALLAVPATVVFGQAWLVVDLLMLMAVPLAATGAFFVARRLVSSTAARLWIATSYGLLPVLTGAVATGHVGTVAATIALPWVVRAAVPIFVHRGALGMRPAWATGLALSVVVAFAPVAWPLAAALALVGAAWLGSQRRPAAATQLLLALVVPAVLLLPWSWRLLTEPTMFLTEAGLVVPDTATVSNSAWMLPFGRLAAVGDAPWWLTGGVLVAALAAALRPDRRPLVLGAWVVAAFALAAAALMLQQPVDVPGTDSQALAWVGFPVVVAQGAAVLAVGLAADGVTQVIGSGSFGWRQPLAAATALLAVLAPLAGLGWWVASASHGELTRAPAVRLPTYMADSMTSDAQRILVVHTSQRPVTYRVLAGDGRRLGDDSVLASEPSDDITGLVTDLLSAGQPADTKSLARHAITYVALPHPAKVAEAQLDALPGLTRASTNPHVLAGWHVTGTDTVQPPVVADPSWRRSGLLALQLVAWLVVIVLAAPGLRRAGHVAGGR